MPDFLENIKDTKFLLIHGEGFGAWCWYKTIALMEEAGLIPVAIDLKGSGIDLMDANRVTTLAEYSEPLVNYLEKLPEDEKVNPYIRDIVHISSLDHLVRYVSCDIFVSFYSLFVGYSDWSWYWRCMRLLRVGALPTKDFESSLYKCDDGGRWTEAF